MALTVGELNAVLSVDDTAIDPTLRRIEGALRASGQRMGSDAADAGEQAGRELGEGIADGAAGAVQGARGELVAAARRAGDAAGDAMGDALADGAEQGADEAVTAAEGGMSRLQMVAAGAGVAAGGALMMGMAQAMEQSQITGRLGAQLGTTPAVAQRYGKIAGEMYASAVTADFQTAADAISTTMRAGLLPPSATNAQIQSIATKVTDLASTFELDLGQSANAVGQIMKTGLAPNAQTALDVITRGLQVMGPRADDIADTFNEYSTIFRQLGISATDATGLMSQGLKAGARDTDVVADALKEFVLITQGGGDEVDKAFAKIGLSGSKMQDAFSKGGPGAKKALDQVFDGLRKVKDPADRSAIALALFGTKAEDTQKALFSLDPSKAAGALGKVGGAADRMGNTLRDNAGANLAAFQRGAMQTLVNVLGGQVVPALMSAGRWMQQHGTEVKIFAGIITAVLVPALILMGVNATVAATRTAAAWTMSGASAARSAGAQVLAAGRVAGAWLMMGVQSMLQAGRMAAAWLIGMGPVGWVIAAVIGLVALIVANWDTVVKYTTMAWDWIWQKVKTAVQAVLDHVAWLGSLPGKIATWFGQMKDRAILKMAELLIWLRGLPGRAVAALSALGGRLSASASSAWERFKTAALLKAATFLIWVRGLPGRIVSYIGNVNSLLVSKGTAVVQGLWSGISSMGGWLKGKILGWARSVIPGPVAKALGIASPSKVTTQQGRWIARGLMEGLTGSTKQVKSAATKLADVVRDSMAPGKKRAKALGRIAADSKQLSRLASQEERLADRMKAAQKKIATLAKDRDKLASDIRKGVMDDANITKMDSSQGISAGSIIDKLRSDRAQAMQFATHLAALRKKGLRADLIAQIAQAGVAQGSASAAALAMASKSEITQLNKEQKLLAGAAKKAGTTAAGAMYGSGVQAAQGLIRGLRSQDKAIESQMMKIAKSMQGAIKKALGIRSPSRVMAALGQYIPAGLVRGIEAGRGAVDRSMAGLVSTPTPGQMTANAMAAAAGARGRERQRPIVISFDGSRGNELDKFLLDRMREQVRKVAGTDVQFAFTGRRA
ncbi:phage tail tape measure protein [Streptomyces sp. NPDC060194]|uniref:phage tail tape measure protein n=1 Tax=Streptomyces sp. NPDC060194 TaxID=3347069 RepID=UPI003650B454